MIKTKLKAEDFGLSPGASMNLKKDQYGTPYHSRYEKKATDVVGLDCMFGNVVRGKPACWFIVPNPKHPGTFGGSNYGKPGEGADLILADVGSADAIEIEGLDKVISGVKCEMREYKHDPENLRWSRYVCTVIPKTT